MENIYSHCLYCFCWTTLLQDIFKSNVLFPIPASSFYFLFFPPPRLFPLHLGRCGAGSCPPIWSTSPADVNGSCAHCCKHVGTFSDNGWGLGSVWCQCPPGHPGQISILSEQRARAYLGLPLGSLRLAFARRSISATRRGADMNNAP